MKITIEPQGEPPGNLSITQTRKTVALLESSPEFEREVLKIRKKYGINKDWLERKIAKPYSSMYHDRLTEAQIEELFEECQVLCASLHLPYEWWISIAHFTAYDLFLTPENYILHIHRHDVGNPNYKVTEPEVCISVNQQVSKNQLFKLITEKWEQIEKEINTLPTIPTVKNTNLELVNEISDLRNDGLTFKQISDQLADKYKDDDRLLSAVISEENLKNIYYRWRNRKKILLK